MALLFRRSQRHKGALPRFHDNRFKSPFACFIAAAAATPCREADLRNRTAFVRQYFAGRPAFAGMIADDTVSAPDAWSSTLAHSNREVHIGAEVLAHVGVTPFPRLLGPETADRC